ncbi:MAG TPA: hypothetical protein VGJ31_11630 [Dongiaceae bacterium]
MAGRRIFGIDFSGAAKAGNLIWLAEAVQTGDSLTITSCRRAADLPGGTVDRDVALAALRTFIAATPDAIFGCDFPFSLPRKLIEEADWPSFIAGFSHRDADAFRAHCRSRSSGREIKRKTDELSRTPWCAYNLRLRHQTFHGLGTLLRPLVLADQAVVLPMQKPREGRPWLIETCPASLLISIGHRPSYKGRKQRDIRSALVSELIGRGLFRELPPEIHRTVIDNAGGDALDSILAAVATAAALSEVEAGRGGDSLEGRVYFKVSTKAA